MVDRRINEIEISKQTLPPTQNQVTESRRGAGIISTQDKILIESRVSNDGPSAAVAYMFWLFLGIVSAHRFYLGRPGSAILQILSYFVLIGFLWILIDAFLIPGMIRGRQQKIRDRLTMELLASS